MKKDDFQLAPFPDPPPPQASMGPEAPPFKPQSRVDRPLGASCGLAAPRVCGGKTEGHRPSTSRWWAYGLPPSCELRGRVPTVVP